MQMAHLLTWDFMGDIRPVYICGYAGETEPQRLRLPWRQQCSDTAVTYQSWTMRKKPRTLYTEATRRKSTSTCTVSLLVALAGWLEQRMENMSDAANLYQAQRLWQN